MKDRGTIRPEFGDSSLRAPINQGITVGQKLSATLRLGEESIGRLEGLNNLRGPGGSVDRNNLALRERMGVDLFTTVVLCSMSGVIKQRDDLLLITLLDKARVMLEAEFDVGTELEV